MHPLLLAISFGFKFFFMLTYRSHGPMFQVVAYCLQIVSTLSGSLVRVLLDGERAGIAADGDADGRQRPLHARNRDGAHLHSVAAVWQQRLVAIACGSRDLRSCAHIMFALGGCHRVLVQGRA